jgi:glycosyltransferase involved in cell wall biosynthesis
VNLLCQFDYGPGINTGFATVSNNLKRELKRIFGDRLKLDICALNYDGDMYKEPDDTDVFSAKKSAFQEAYDDFGRIGFAKVLQLSYEDDGSGQKGYDGIFILHDLGVILPYAPLIKKVKDENRMQGKKQFKSIFYFPIDAEIRPETLKDIDIFDRIVTYTEFARAQVLKHRPDLRSQLNVVPHGIDTKTFYPLPADQAIAFRKDYFGRHADKFIISNVNRNQHRKDIPATLFAFKEYQQRRRNGFLYLHMHPNDPLGWDIRSVAECLDLREGRDYAFPPEQTIQKDGKTYTDHQTTSEVLNGIYNASDVFLTTTRGEGWGLSVTEAMACKLPVICPMNTSLIEISNSGDRVYPLWEQYPVASTHDSMVRGQVDPDEVADQLERVYKEKKENTRDHISKVERAYLYITQLTWEKVARRWADIFREVY